MPGHKPRSNLTPALLLPQQTLGPHPHGNISQWPTLSPGQTPCSAFYIHDLVKFS